MRKPKSITNLTFPRPLPYSKLTDEFWGNFENVLGITLSNQTREEISTIRRDYITAMGHIQSGANNLKLLKQRKKDGSKFAKFQKTIEEVNNLYFQLLSDKNYEETIIMLDGEIAVCSYQKSLNEAMTSIQIIDTAIKKLLAGKAVKVEGNTANDKKNWIPQIFRSKVPDPYLFYIRQLANVLVSLKIKVNKTKPTDASRKPQKLDLCLEALDKTLPPEIQENYQSIDKWAQDRYRAVK
ncbi:MAG: hypothetical protein KA155_07050 [Alphaproteobacteria bacterium]|nr:hypothetical protein [Alphaproteobacteria bacterium]